VVPRSWQPGGPITLASVIVTVPVAGPVPVRGAGGDDLTLLRSFEPVVRYTEGELFFPTCVQAYVAQCSLWAGADGRAGGEGRAESLLVPAGALTLDGLCDVAHTSRRDRPLHLRFVQEPLDRASYRQWRRADRPRLRAQGRDRRADRGGDAVRREDDLGTAARRHGDRDD